MILSRKRLYELFETKWLMMRQNPGGKSAYLQGYLLGFTGIVNIADALTDKKAILKLKIGSGDVQVREVIFETSEITVNEAVVALNKALFRDCVFSIDDTTKRLKISAKKSVKFIQIYGDLAAALNFGNCKLNEGKGLYILPSFEGDLKSIAETEQWKEDTVIENDSPMGAPVKLTIPGKRTGSQIVVTDRLDSRAAKQMINGGRWISGTIDSPDIYEPPTTSDSDSKKVDVFTYSKVFEKNTNVEGDELFVRERMYIGCVGKRTQTGGAGSWKDGEFTLTAADYKDEDGNDCASPRESDFTQSQWDALHMKDVIVEDWEEFEDITEPANPDEIAVISVSINKNSTSIIEGNSETLVPTVLPINATNPKLVWDSSDPNVATVNENGKVTAVAEGNCNITVSTVDGNYTAECEVEVTTV